MILDSLILQAKLFFEEDMEISILNSNDIEITSPEKLILKNKTSMIGTGGKLNTMIVISFDNQILSKLVELFMEGEEVDEEEKEEVEDSVAGEVLNTILGLALPTFPNRGKGITITPPISVNDASSIYKHKDSKIISAIVKTEFGELVFSAVGSKDEIK
ncbi:chemotaxis protein CheX [Halarcobacter sp.]|uniref:chemotaxis protein CheX n=1 Tax=Halarcobacter sp. TaxID=2321133 RepID=UPI0029F48F58|nr:chemotaxis protein CheX [Halarcobacter sp.]